MINLIIVNCQSDFVTGTRGGKGIKNTIENIKKFIKNHVEEIDKIIFAIEWHPYNHVSFKKYGGEYPPHCVKYTPGACIEPKLLKFVHSLDINYDVSVRGEMEELDDEAFGEIEYVQDVFGNFHYFDSLVSANADNEYVVCGISNSVEAAIHNMLEEGINPKVFCSGIYHNDGGQAFSKFIKDNKIEKIAQ